jgi:hypothetical protein
MSQQKILDELTDLEEATQRIEIAKSTLSTKLDLSRLSRLSNFPPAISELENLNILYIGKTAISDLTPITALKNLNSFSLSFTAVRSLAPLSGMQNLRNLAITGSPISDLSPLQTCYELRELVLNNTPVCDLTPISKLYKLQVLLLSRTRITDLSPIADLLQLVTAAERQPQSGGIAFFDTPIADEYLKHLAKAPNPWRTFETISYLRRTLNLPEINSNYPRQPELPFDKINWADRIAQLQQTPLGARFIRRDDMLAIDPAGDETDIAVASETLTQQLHEGLRRRANECRSSAQRLDNQIGWSGFGEVTTAFFGSIDCETMLIPERLGTVYETLVAIGSFLELDGRLRATVGKSAADPLDPEVRRLFSDLIRIAAPWIRRFPTVRLLDDEAGAFLTRTELYEPAEIVVDKAAKANIISENDARLLQTVIDAAKRGEFQGQKAGARSIWSSKNLISALALILSFETGLINSRAADQSIIAAKGAQFYLAAEGEILQLFDDAPDDIREAIKLMIDDLRKKHGGDVPLQPQPIKESKRRREVD